MSDWTLTNNDGELLLHTGVEGRAARTGHNLEIRMDEWTATAETDGDGHPTSVRLSVPLDSMEVVGAQGGLTMMTKSEKKVARGNALKSMNAKKNTTVEYVSSDVQRDGDTYAVSGQLTINGITRAHPLTVTANGAAFSCETVVAQTNFGIKPYSLMMGALKVADQVTISITATVPNP
ncbi:MAG: YceI family protein [Gordonia sp. (in: high G+C Gram-positive bacteria)]|uniref:YceI family protein n=1 Tax=Gordonia sp. (in: high G+C Gram-positive bacteria) TaxID=84139 RepID=UPI0039E6416B